MVIGSSSGLTVTKLALDVYKRVLAKEMKQRNMKKGLLIKIYEANSKRSGALDEILTESDQLNNMRAKAERDANMAGTRDAPTTQSEEEFLKKFRDMPKGGPTHSIAETRKNHLTNFLSEYILNAFQSGLFVKPELTEFFTTWKSTDDVHGFAKNKYDFEISNVELMADLSALKIHWMISGVPEIDTEVECYLEKCLSGQIRSTLTNERVLNYVPRVVFVRDETKVKLEQLDEQLMKIKIDLEKSAPTNETSNAQNDR